MKATQQYLNTLHTENLEWRKRLGFYRDELKSFENRLAEVAMANSATEVLSQVEHFQNQFILQKEIIDTLQHEINIGEDKILVEIKQNEIATDHRKMEDHDALREQLGSFEQIFGELRSEFQKFLALVF